MVDGNVHQLICACERRNHEMKLVSKILTFGEGRKFKRCEALVGEINGLEPAWQALSDEVDFILIDEARTPLIVLGGSSGSAEAA